MLVKEHAAIKRYLNEKNSSGHRVNRDYLLTSLVNNYKNNLENLLNDAEVTELEDGNYEIKVHYAVHTAIYTINGKLVNE